MSMNRIPDSVYKARKISEIEAAAKLLHSIDSTEAIEPLARLSRRAPGWIVIELTLIVRLILSLIGFALSFGLIAIGVWSVYNAIAAFLQTFFPEWQIDWWTLWAGFTLLWIWRDARLRTLLEDNRFRPLAEHVTHVWVIILKPFYALAGALRLCAALIFLTFRLVLSILAIVAIIHGWQVFQSKLMPDLDQLFTYGFAAGALFLAFGLFVFSEWPRQRTQPYRTRRQRYSLLGVAVLLAAALGLLVRELSGSVRDQIGLVTAGVMLITLTRFLFTRSTNAPFDMKWIQSLFVPRWRLDFTARQIKFLQWSLFLLGLFGLGLLCITFAQHWTSIRPRVPEIWLNSVRDLYGYSSPFRVAAYSSLEPWLFGLTIGCFIGFLGAFYSIGWAISLSKPFAWPFFWLADTANIFMARVSTRLAIRDAIRHHRARNKRLIGGFGRQAVCREHLARFEPRTVTLAYRHKWKYWRCRVCRSDVAAYTGVQILSGVLDQHFTGAEAQQGHILAVNLLLRLEGSSAPMPLDLDEVEIGCVEDQHDIEKFVIQYQAFATPVNKPALKQIRLRVNAEAHLEPNIERIVSNAFRK